MDRFEQEQADFFLRVRAAYLDRAQRFPDRIKFIDSNRSLPEVKVAVEQILQPLLHHE